jgi:predicted membrane channel-forming protein YqfA (hemolysin III family)
VYLVGIIKNVYANCRIILNSSCSLAQNTTQICDVSVYLMDLLDLVIEKHLYRTKTECASEKKRLKMFAYIHIYSKSQLIQKIAP